MVLLFLGYVVGSTLLLLLPTAFIGPLFVVGGFLFVVVIGVHYLLWGRWLSKLLAEEAQRQAAARAEGTVTEDQAP